MLFNPMEPFYSVKTIYLNSVKLRLVLGVFTFIFDGVEIEEHKTPWSVPFVSDKKRQKYLRGSKKMTMIVKNKLK